MTCIVQALLYSLDSVHMTTAARKKLDGFQARCLRKILGVKSAYINRISNQFILQQFDASPLSATLLARQLEYFGLVANMPMESPQRMLVFANNSLELKQQKLKRGRPRDTWAKKLKQHALQIDTEESSLQEKMKQVKTWKKTVQSYCKQIS